MMYTDWAVRVLFDGELILLMGPEVVDDEWCGGLFGKDFEGFG